MSKLKKNNLGPDYAHLLAEVKSRIRSAQYTALKAVNFRAGRAVRGCRAFLRTIGIKFDESELVAPTDEPADVAFRTARFQIREILDPDRRRGDDWKHRDKKYTEAKSLDKLIEPYSPPTPVTLATLVPEIVSALSEKSQKYGTGCNDIDALVYVNLQDHYLTAHSKIPSVDELKLQGWRSVAFLFLPYGVILFSKPAAPSFLTTKEPRQFMEWKDIDSLFEA